MTTKEKTTEKTLIATSHDRTSLKVSRPASLVIIYGQDLGRSYPLEEQITIGRSATNDIALDINSVSRKHALVFRREGAFLVKDLESTNGTRVNDTRVEG